MSWKYQRLTQIEREAAEASAPFVIQRVTAERHRVFRPASPWNNELEAECERFAGVFGPRNRKRRAKPGLQVFLEQISWFDNVRITVD
jgi:hypothetical protein